MGLLDDFSGFIKTPEGQGLLSGVAGLMAGARKGAPINSLGIGALAGLRGYDQAQEQEIMRPFKEAQLAEANAKIAQRKRQEQALLSASPEVRQAVDMGVPFADVWKQQNPGPKFGYHGGSIYREDQLDPTTGAPKVVGQLPVEPTPLEKALNAAGITDPLKRAEYTQKGLDKLVTHPEGTKVTVAGSTYEPQFSKELATLDAKQLDSYRTKADAARGMLTTANKLEQLNPNVYAQGGAEAKLATVNFLQGMGIDVGDPKKVADSQQFESLTTRMVLDSLGGSLGAGVSNADVAFIKNTVPQLGHSMKARTELINFLRSKATKSLKTYDSARAYAEDPKNRGLKGWKPEREVIRTGKYGGRDVIEYDDGSIEYGK